MLVRPAGAKSEPVVIDYRETAPAAATKDLFAKDGTQAAPGRRRARHASRGLALAHQKFGKLPWKDLVAPAVKLAEEGFAIDDAAGRLAQRRAGARQGASPSCSASSARTAAKWKAGDRLVQQDLAETLRRIAEQGAGRLLQGRDGRAARRRR